MKNIILVFTFIVFVDYVANSQNLVPNSGFETGSGTPPCFYSPADNQTADAFDSDIYNSILKRKNTLLMCQQGKKLKPMV